MPELPRHGSIRRYKAGCACDLCTAKNTEQKAKERDAKRAREGKPPLRTRAKATVPTGASEPTAAGAYGPIETAARAALAMPAEAAADAITALRREVVFGAARIMDNSAKPHLFATQANVIRVTVADMIAEHPPRDGELDELRNLVGSFGSPRGRRDAAPVGDAT